MMRAFTNVLATLLLLGAYAAEAAPPKADSAASYGSPQEFISMLQEKSIVREKHPEGAFVVNMRPDEKAVPAKSKELLEHVKKVNEGEESFADYPYIDAIIGLYRRRLNVEDKLPADWYEIFLNVGCKPKYATPLHLACYSSKPLEKIKQLLKGGADVNAEDDDGETPLHAAMRCRLSAKCIQELIKAKARVNARNKRGELPLHLGVQSGIGMKSLQLMLSAGANKTAQTDGANFGSESVMDLAIEYANEKTIANMIAFGFDPKKKNVQGYDALGKACSEKRGELITFFLKHGCSLDEKQGRIQTTPFLLCCSWCDEKLFRLFVEKKVNFKEKDTMGWNAFHKIVYNPSATVYMIDTLVKNGADINAKGTSGYTPLHNCAMAKNPCPMEVLEAMIRAGADLNIRNARGQTPLEVAEKNRHAKMVEVMRRAAKP